MFEVTKKRKSLMFNAAILSKRRTCTTRSYAKRTMVSKKKQKAHAGGREKLKSDAMLMHRIAASAREASAVLVRSLSIAQTFYPSTHYDKHHI